MKKAAIIIIPVLGVIVLAASGAIRLKTKEAAAMRSWQSVQSAYRERVELLPRIVSSAAPYIGHNHQSLLEIAAALDIVKQEGTAPTSAPSPAFENTLKCFEYAQTELTRAVARLTVVEEQNSRLASNPEFVSLSRQLELIESHINNAQKDYNQAVHDFNISKKNPVNALGNALFMHSPDRLHLDAEGGAKIVVGGIN